MDLAEIGRESPLFGEVWSPTKSRSGFEITKYRTGPLLSEAAAMVHLLTDPALVNGPLTAWPRIELTEFCILTDSARFIEESVIE